MLLPTTDLCLGDVWYAIAESSWERVLAAEDMLPDESAPEGGSPGSLDTAEPAVCVPAAVWAGLVARFGVDGVERACPVVPDGSGLAVERDMP